jgi:chromosome segregation ATPase
MQESQEALEKRIAALERAITDGEADCGALAEGAATAERVEALEAQLADLRDQVGELDAATQALRGYVGNVRSVNRDVERRADAALSKVESLEADQDGQASGEPAEQRCPRCGRGGPDPEGDESNRSDAEAGRRPEYGQKRRASQTQAGATRETEAERPLEVREGTETARAVAFDEGESPRDHDGAGVETGTDGVMGRVRELL